MASATVKVVYILALGTILAFVGRSPSPVAADSESPFCSLPPDPATPWLPSTPLTQEAAIPAPRPAPDCQFYRPAWQQFMATQPNHGLPAFVNYPSFPEMFGSSGAASGQGAKFTFELSPRNLHRPNDPSDVMQNLLDNTQAGLDDAQGGYLIDQDGRFVYYAIHVNPTFLQFLRTRT